MGCARHLTLVSSGRVDARIESGWGAKKGFQAHRASDIGDMAASKGAQKGKSANRSNRLSAVQKRQTFFRL